MPFAVTADGQDWKNWDDPVRGALRWCLLVDSIGPEPESLTTGVLQLGAGGWLGRHRHTAPEVYYVLEGSAIVAVDGKEMTVGPGSLVRFEADVEHGIHAPEGPVRVLFLFPTTNFEDVVYRFTAEPAA